MSLIAAYLFWFAEFSLEVSGAVYSRRIPALRAYLAFCAFADISTFLIHLRFGWNAYGYADWIQKAGQYFLLAWLACEVCGKFMDEKNRKQVTRVTWFMAAVGALMMAVSYLSGKSLADSILDTVITAAMLLGIFVLLGWMDRRKRLDTAWQAIAVGLMLILGWNGLMAWAWKFWPEVRHFYFAGEIAVLVSFNYAATRMEISDMRQGLGVVCEPTERIESRVI